MKTLFLVDASSLFFRAFFAIPPLTSAKGLPTNAIYGFLNQLIRLLRDKKPDHIVLCLDRKEPSFRKDLYSDYKANRTEIPETLAPQMPYIDRVGTALGIPSISVAGFEADDVIGTLATQASAHGMKVCIVSGDKDFAQLINDHIFMYDTMKDFTFGPKEVVEKWGVRPDQFIDYLALVGDSSDHIPGVAGIGPKGASKLLADHETLDRIYENIGSIKGATQEKLIKSKEMAYLSRKLVSIVRDVPVPTRAEDLHLQKISLDELKSFFEELNFKSFERDSRGLPNTGSVEEPSNPPAAKIELSSLLPPMPAPTPTPVPSLDIKPLEVRTIASHEIAQHLQPRDAIWLHSDAKNIFLLKEGSDFILSLQDSADDVGRELVRLDLSYLGYDLKSLWHKLWPTRALEASGQLGFLTNSDSGGPGLGENISLRLTEDLLLFGYVLHAGENLALAALIERGLGQLAPDSLTELRLMPSLRQKMQLEMKSSEHSDNFQKVLNEIEYPLVSILFNMERRGFQIDRKELALQSESLQKDLALAEKQIHEMAGETFNIASPKQLSHILFDKLKLKTGKRTKTGFSTDSDVLESLRDHHQIVAQILEYREVAKLKSTYVDALPSMLDSQDRIHTTFRQALTTTGRLSSVEPNLQNIPIRSPRGARVRRAFVAADGQALLSADYSQIELRVLAHFCGDANMRKAFVENLDIHTATASEVFKVPLKEVTSEQRRIAKSVNFGIAYGQGAFGLAENLGISRTEAQDIIQKYFTQFPGVKEYIDSTTSKVREAGFVQTLLGRVRTIREIQSQSPVMRKAGERAAINAPIQGTAADIVKLAMVRINEAVSVPMISQVHDELIFEGKETVLRSEAPQIVQIMESVVKLSVPLKVNWAIGANWDEAH